MVHYVAKIHKVFSYIKIFYKMINYIKHGKYCVDHIHSFWFIIC